MGGGREGGGLITVDVLLCLQVDGPVTQWRRFSVGRGGGTHKRKFTLFTTRDTYNSTH